MGTRLTVLGKNLLREKGGNVARFAAQSGLPIIIRNRSAYEGAVISVTAARDLEARIKLEMPTWRPAVWPVSDIRVGLLNYKVLQLEEMVYLTHRGEVVGAWVPNRWFQELKKLRGRWAKAEWPYPFNEEVDQVA